MLAPETVALLARSLRTLPVRVRQQNANAQAVAEALSRHSRVARVLYPGLPDFPGVALAQKQMSGFGGMVSLEIAGDGAAATAVADKFKLFALAPRRSGKSGDTTLHHYASRF